MEKHSGYYSFPVSKSLLLRLSSIVPLVFILIISWSPLRSQSKTEILWDNYGVPHIYASGAENMYYAYGWAQMHNHANLLLHLYGEARGRAAEYWGADYLDLDRKIHLFNIPLIASEHYLKQKGENKKQLDAFVKGINDYARANPEKIASGVKPVLPVVGTDVLSHIMRIIYLEFVASRDIRVTMQEVVPGSNSYAIGKSKSASGNAMLVANPHLPWSDFYTFFEAHLTAPGFNAYGVSLVGMPVLNIAFNNYLGWTHTVNTLDGSDKYELTLVGDGYLLDGKTVPFDKRSVSLKVIQPDGTTKTVEKELMYSKHGPVLGRKGDKAYALRIVGLDNAFFSAQYHNMAKARNLKEFEDAVRMLQIPCFNILYADNRGSIFYLFNGNVPKRNQGDWTFWYNTIDGTRSEYIWKSYHSYEDLPKLTDPATGFLQNTNDPPWTSTYPDALYPSDFPAYMSPIGTSLRPQRAINLVRNDTSITFDELVGYKLNTGMEAADRFLDELFKAADQYPDSAALQAVAVLKNWDRGTNTNSRGAVLFAKWFDKLNADMYKNPWDSANPVTTPNGLKDMKSAVELLSMAAKETKEKYGSLDIPWGDVYRFHLDDMDLPANGAPDKYGVYRTMYYDKENRAFYGDTYIAVTEFGEKVRAEVLLSYGNASQPGTRHRTDQLEMLSQNKLRPALLERAEILKHTEKKELLPLVNKKP